MQYGKIERIITALTFIDITFLKILNNSCVSEGMLFLSEGVLSVLNLKDVNWEFFT